MINELLFLGHITLISGCVLFFARLGKTALTSFVSLLFILANLFVLKQMSLFSFFGTCADPYIIGVSFGINVIQEQWGKKYSRQAIWISFALSLFYMLMTLFQLSYIPAPFDTTQPHFHALLSNTIRLIVASFISYLTVQLLDTYLYAWAKKKTHGRYFVLRNYLSMCSSQLFDTILFSFLGLYGIVNHITHIMIVSYGIKLFSIILTTPFLWLTTKLISSPQKELTEN